MGERMWVKSMCKKSFWVKSEKYMVEKVQEEFLGEESLGESMCKKSFWVKSLWVKSMCKKSFWVKSLWEKVCARRVSG